MQNRVSLRETGLIRAPQHPLAINELSQNTDYGFAPDTRFRPTASPEHYVVVEALVGGGRRTELTEAVGVSRRRRDRQTAQALLQILAVSTDGR